MVILGCDVSTTTIGYCFLKNTKILDMGFIDISKQDTFKQKAMYAFEYLQDMEYFDNVDRICVEDSLSNFSRGRSSIQTIIKLAKFNAIFSFILEWGFQDEVILVNPNTARKTVFGKARVKGKTAKDFVKENVEKKYNTKKWTILNKRGNFDKRNIDAYDATVVALYGYEM